MHKPVLYLMLGYPGAGKTTTARVLHKLTGAEHIWADHERRKRFGVPVHTPAENRLLYDDLNTLTGELLAKGKSVIFDTNFNFYRDRQKLRDMAKHNHAKAFVVWVTTPKHIAQERATHEGHLTDTRVLGTMPVSEFERMSNNLEPPKPDEEIIEVDGTKVSDEYIKTLLTNLNIV